MLWILIFSRPVLVWMRGTLIHCAYLTWCFIVPCNDYLPVLVEFMFERGITPFLLYQIVRVKKKVSLKIYKVNVEVKLTQDGALVPTSFNMTLLWQETCM